MTGKEETVRIAEKEQERSDKAALRRLFFTDWVSFLFLFLSISFPLPILNKKERTRVAKRWTIFLSKVTYRTAVKITEE